MNDTVSAKVTITYISFLGALLYWGKETAFFWILTFLILGNVRRISKGGFFWRFIRMTLYFFPFLLPLIFCNVKLNLKNNSLCSILIPILIGLLYWFLGRKGFRIMLATERIKEIEVRELYNPVFFIYNHIGAAIGEELFFRYYLLNGGKYIFASALLSSIMFVCYHYTLEWGAVFSAKDFIRQFIIGIINCLLFVIFDSIIPCFIVHLCCNMPEIIMNIKIILLKKGIITCPAKQEADIDF